MTTKKTNAIEKPGFAARSLLLGERIDLRALETKDIMAITPLTLRVRGGSVAVLFRYGVVVLFDVEPMEETSFLDQLRAFVKSPYDRPEIEATDVRLDPGSNEGVEANTISIKDSSIEKLQVIADVLAKSVVLNRYEQQVAVSFDKVEPVAAGLKHRGRSWRRARELLRYIGDSLVSEQTMVGRVEVSDKPEVLWTRPDLEGLYVRLEDEYEIRERHSTIEHKLELISRTAETVLDLLHNRHSLRVEWYIVILILVEIFLTLYEMFFRGHGL
ncbi:MAG: RMD1 family protein [Kiritimatiellae bacterium]|nr:RMD1 family protein [Kiritimatiellia bacterium]